MSPSSPKHITPAAAFLSQTTGHMTYDKNPFASHYDMGAFPGSVPDALSPEQRSKLAPLWLDSTRPGGTVPYQVDVSLLAHGREEQPTTVVVRNMSRAITRDVFLEVLDAKGFWGQYDFVYLPKDYGKGCCFGFAFVNLVTPEAARHFHEVFGVTSQSAELGCVEVGWATLQGLHRHVEKFRNSPVMHESMDDETKPIILKDGKRTEFPLPTRKIGTVRRLRTRRPLAVEPSCA
ncbi:unnamed protein product [Prorocentrum cordatum]|uniref:Mei2-like C-terminal RNA recognition motif domain-containing protein n=1 Tax=Prorocentrum cordatum TaxID=2364126 RepID=A0ABN9U121_9DINO|nr:unnamed protein product [Polarella glacialis]